MLIRHNLIADRGFLERMRASAKIKILNQGVVLFPMSQQSPMKGLNLIFENTLSPKKK